MKIYKVGALVSKNIEDLDINVEVEKYDADGNETTQLTEDEMKEKVRNEMLKENPDGKYTFKEIFYISEYSFTGAVVDAMEKLEEFYGKENYEIYLLESLKDETGEDIEVFERCSCPYCEFEKATPDNKMIFQCGWCGEELKVADGWSVLECGHCDGGIHRENVKVATNGSYVHDVDAEEKFSEDNSKND